MAKLITGNYKAKSKTKRPGIHSKTKCSKGKQSQNYKKPYRGQGR